LSHQLPSTGEGYREGGVGFQIEGRGQKKFGEQEGNEGELKRGYLSRYGAGETFL